MSSPLNNFIKVRCIIDEYDVRIGFFDDERAQNQRVQFDVTVFLDDKPFRGGTGKLTDTTDYRALKSIVAKCITEKSEHVLLETLGSSICDSLLEQTQAEASEVTMHKPKLKENGIDAYVTVRRTRA